MKELYFFDETFYWGRSGRRATVIEAECELTQSVRPDELRAAVVSAQKLRPQIEANHIEVGYSNSRTCEIGLETNTGIPYMSIVYLVNECTTKKG